MHELGSVHVGTRPSGDPEKPSLVCRASPQGRGAFTLFLGHGVKSKNVEIILEYILIEEHTAQKAHIPLGILVQTGLDILMGILLGLSPTQDAKSE